MKQTRLKKTKKKPHELSALEKLQLLSRKQKIEEDRERIEGTEFENNDTEKIAESNLMLVDAIKAKMAILDHQNTQQQSHEIQETIRGEGAGAYFLDQADGLVDDQDGEYWCTGKSRSVCRRGNILIANIFIFISILY